MIIRHTCRTYIARGCHPAITVTYVLTEAGAFAGVGSPKWVAHATAKLIYREAVAYFPDLDEDTY